MPWKKLSSWPAKSREMLRTTSVSTVRITVAKKATRNPQSMKKCAMPVARFRLATVVPLAMV